MASERPRTSRGIRLCVIVNPSFGLTLPFGKRWEHLMARGFDCTGVAGPGPEHEIVRRRGVKTHVVPMERYPSPFKDLVSLVRLWWFLLWRRFDIVHVSSPKASFLGALAGRLSGHRRVVYTVRGRPYEHMTGWRRKAMNACEWITCHLARRVVPVARELGEAFVAEGLCPRARVRVIHHGSSNGVDLARFTRTEENVRLGRQMRRDLGIPEKDRVILFVGWVRRDKGANEMVDAFRELAERHQRLHLVMLGNYEDSDACRPDVIECIETHERIHRLPWRREPAPVYAMADVVALPSYREGMPKVPLEAAAMELASVVSDVMGCRESVQKDVTGLLVPPGDAGALRDALRRLIDEPSLRERLARNGRRRVEKEFRQELIWDGVVSLYRELMGQDDDKPPG